MNTVASGLERAELLPGFEPRRGVAARTLLDAPDTASLIMAAEIVSDLAAQMVAEPARPTLLQGPPGIGKTNLTLAALNDDAVLARFADRRWFVRCDAATSATALTARIATVLDLPPASEPLAGVLAKLSRGPGAIALDNFETPWKAGALAVEELLAALAAVPGVAPRGLVS